jgi:hypothetical protein
MGVTCARPTCHATENLEIHHTGPGWAATKTTTLNDLAPLCRHDHHLVTHQGHTLHGPPGHRVWTCPDGTTEHERPPPPTG